MVKRRITALAGKVLTSEPVQKRQRTREHSTLKPRSRLEMSKKRRTTTCWKGAVKLRETSSGHDK